MAPSRGIVNNAVVRPTLQTQELPPSTLAAQIVDCLTKTKEHSEHQVQESFRQLLREILDADDGKEGQSDSIETNVEINHKIIYVVVRSGIETLFQDDPFNKKDELMEQGLSSLAVIGLTIQRSPEVLFFRPKVHEADLKLGGPLFLWLIPILLSILAWDGDCGIQEAALKVLQIILTIERKTHCRGVKPQSVLRYIQGCIKGKSSNCFLFLPISNEPVQRPSLLRRGLKFKVSQPPWLEPSDRPNIGDNLRSLAYNPGER